MPTEKTTRVSRSTNSRRKTWQPASSLDAPQAPEGYKYRWVRHMVRSEDDVKNVLARGRQHYEPVYEEEVAEGQYSVVEEGRKKGIISVGDLILMKVPEEIAKQRKEHYHAKARGMQRAVDLELDRQDSDLAPIDKVRKSSVSYGKRGSGEFQDD